MPLGRRRRGSTAGLLCLALSAAVMWGAARPASAPSVAADSLDLAATPTVRVRRTPVLWSADMATVPVEVLDVVGLGATTVMVTYDNRVLNVANCRRGGAFDLGLCNPALDRDEDGQPDTTRFNAVALEGVSARSNQPIVLALIDFTFVDRPALGSAVPLGVEIETFTDVDGVPMIVGGQSGEIRMVDRIGEALLPYVRRPPN